MAAAAWEVVDTIAEEAVSVATAGRVQFLPPSPSDILQDSGKFVAKRLARQADDVAETVARRASVSGPGRIYSSRTASEIAEVAAKPTSVKQLQQKLGRAGLINPSKVRIVRAGASEVPDVPGMTFYGWVSQTGSGLLKDQKGRFIIKITDDGLSSLKTAVSTIGHELHHIKEALAGAGVSEAAANAAGEEMLTRFLKWMSR